ncbi:cytochrome P450 [Desarmillaria tabescens]|uniref:Cytochrome P450 n=1 Tax=Armillaria tabescens TaxID=1929756 RepID=A0AA39U8L0_ARMTA|nr:cytochrome P450 [Desarmillaria tabescens]KAK0469620.1 cytochrome P450 [Desarmillaria tabescens]
MVSLLIAFLVCVLLVYLLSRLSLKHARLPLPPGPKGLPFIGNLWDVPAEYPWLTYARWAATYGDIFYLDTPGNLTVVINSAEVAADLFEKRSGIYSDRPDFTMINLVGWGFNSRAVPAYYPVQMKATLVLLQQLLKSPDEFVRHGRHHAGSVIMKTVYGYDVDPNGDRFVVLVDRAMESLRIIGNVGTFLVDYIPSMKYLPRWFPGANFMNLADAWRKDVEEMVNGPFAYASESMANGIVTSSFVSENLTKMKETSMSEKATRLEIVRNAAGVAFAAGADTTVSVILSTMLAFLLYPEVQAKAQAELDAVVGPTRLPNFDDRPQLPYIDAILFEALRWNPTVPMGVAHRSLNADIYKGYYIPAGATVVGNTWAILHDEKFYPNPLVFDPDRFIPEEGKEPQPEPIAVFGFGRRICPGRYLALNSAWIVIASMASTLSFTKAIDSEGRVIEPSDTFTDGFLRQVLSHKLSHTFQMYYKGNLWDVPVEYPWLTYTQWASTYGDVFYLDTPGNPTVVINSAQAAADLFEKRSAFRELLQ